MNSRRFLGSNIEVSELGFGCWAIGGHGYGDVDDRESIEAIRTALSEGVNIFDTADVYGFGHSEEILSKALGAEKSKVVIATKGGVRWDSSGRTQKDSSAAYLREAVNNSLRRLRVESITLYQLHWYDSVTPLDEVFGVLWELQGEGKIRHVGLSNAEFDTVREAQGYLAVLSNQTQYSYLDRENEALIARQATELGVSSISYGVLGRGLLTGKYAPNCTFELNDTRGTDDNFGSRFSKHEKEIDRLVSVAKSHGVIPAQVALRWVLNNPNVTCALVGMKTRDQVRSNCNVLANSEIGLE